MKLVIFLALAICIMANSCGGNCPSGGCPSCLCGTTTSPQSISFWCSKYTWNQSCCQCVMNKESGGNANALNYNTNGSYDVGLWQINQMNWGQCNGGSVPCDPTKNLNCAIDVYKWGGNTFKLWSTGAGCGCA